MIKRVVKYLLAVLALLLLAWAVVAMAGWSIPAGFLRAGLTQELNEDLAPLRLRLEGPIRLTPTLTPVVSMQDIKVLRPDPKLAPIDLGRLSIKVSLLSLLRGDVNLEKVRVSDVHLPLVPADKGKEQAALHFSEITGSLQLSQDRAVVEDLVLRLGHSTLTGQVRVDSNLNPPKLVIHLHASRVDVDSLIHMVALEDSETNDITERRQSLLATLDNVVERLFKTVQGELKLSAEHLHWQGRTAGPAELNITLKDHRLAIERFLVQLPEGKIFLSNAIQSTAAGVSSNLEAQVRNFSYGFLTRKTPKSPMRSQGVISLRMALSSRAPKVSGLLGRADGTLQVGVWPQNLRTASFDLWAANLLFALLDSLVAQTGAQVNCAVGDFVMKDGLMTSKKLIIDTSKTRVEGKAEFNFAKRTMNVHLQPRAKQPQFFNLETPIDIKGALDQASAGVTPGGLMGSVIHFATSPVFAPLRRLFGDTLPEQGRDVCRNPESWPPAASAK